MFSKKKKKIEISAPSNFQHRVHTGFDNSSNKFVGLPRQWASLVGDEAGSASPHRPAPLVDPSAITPTDMLEMKPVVRGDAVRKKIVVTCLYVKMYCRASFFCSEKSVASFPLIVFLGPIYSRWTAAAINSISCSSSSSSSSMLTCRPRCSG